MLKKQFFKISVDKERLKKRSRHYLLKRNDPLIDLQDLLENTNCRALGTPSTADGDPEIENKENLLKKFSILSFNTYGSESHSFAMNSQYRSEIRECQFSYGEDFYSMRTRVVDFLVDVINSFEENYLTLFHAISLLDLYISKREQQIEKNDLLLIGVTCLYISSKLLDPISISINVIQEKIVHGRYSK